MIKLVLSWLFRRRGQWLLVVVNALLLTVALIVFNVGSASATLTADRGLRNYWRTTYDLLVRNASAVAEVERNHSLIRSNHLSGTPGGITMAQYETIRQLPGVEIAAPIAMLGYIPRPEIMVGIRDPLPTGIYRVEASSVVDAGPGKNQMSVDPYYALFLRASADDIPSQQVSQELAHERSRLSLVAAGTEWLGFTVKAPHFDDRALVAAIDPDQEARLLLLDQMVVEGSYFPSGGTPVGESGSFPRFPVLLNLHDYVDQEITIKIEQVDVAGFPSKVEGINADLIRELHGVEDRPSIEQAPRHTVWERTVPIGREWRKVGLALQLYGDEILEPVRWTSGFIGEVLAPSPVRYRFLTPEFDPQPGTALTLEAIPEGITETSEHLQDVGSFLPEQELALERLKLWNREPETIYRRLEPRFENPLLLDVELLGSFEIDPLLPLRGASPNQVPLETYLPPIVQVVRDLDGNPVEPAQELRPTLNYQGYLVSPPDVLMDINQVSELLSRSCAQYTPLSQDEPPYWQVNPIACSPVSNDFISAIRVKVAGIDGLTPEAQVKIETLAEQIVTKTGLHVDIMVGSSPEPVLVRLPGDDGSKGTGYVRELWVKKNVHTIIRSGMTRAEGLLFAAMVISAMSFLFSANFLSFNERTKEFGLLQALGWRRRDMFLMLVGESALLGAMSGGVGAALAAAAVQIYDFPSGGTGPAWLVPAGAAFFIAGAVVPAWRSVSREPVEVLEAGEVEGTGIRTGVHSILTYSLNGLLRQPARALITGIGLLISSSIIVFLKLTLDQLGGDLYGTLLGQWIRIEITPYHLTMALVALLAALSSLSMATLLNVARRSPETRLMRAVGWRNSHIVRAFLWESLLLALVSSAAGTLLGMFLHVAVYGATELTASRILSLSALGMVVPSALAVAFSIFPTSRAVWTLGAPAFRQSLQGEGSGEVRHSTSVLAAIILVLVAGMIAYGNFFWQPAGGDTLQGLETKGAIVKKVQAKPMAIHRVELQSAPAPAPGLAYDLRLKLDPSDGLLSGSSLVQYENQTGAQLAELLFLLYPNMPSPGAVGGGSQPRPLSVRRVSVEGTAVAPVLASNGWELIIPLEQPIPDGRSVSVGIDFRLQTKDLSGDFDRPVLLKSFFPMLALNQHGKWFTDPCMLCADRTLSPAFDMEARVIGPPGIQVLGTGEAAPTDGLNPEFDFYVRAGQDFGLLFMPRVSPELSTIGGEEIAVYSLLPDPDLPKLDEYVQAVFQKLQSDLGDYPMGQVDLVVYPSEITSGVWAPGIVSIGVQSLDPEFERVLADEVVLGYASAVQIDASDHPWLDTSIGELVSLNLLESENPNSDVAAGRWDELRSSMEFRESLAGHSIPLDQDFEEYQGDVLVFFAITYGKGALFLDQVQDAIGEEAFNAGLRLYIQRFKNRRAGPLELLAAMESASSTNLAPVFLKWGAITLP